MWEMVRKTRTHNIWISKTFHLTCQVRSYVLLMYRPKYHFFLNILQIQIIILILISITQFHQIEFSVCVPGKMPLLLFHLFNVYLLLSCQPARPLSHSPCLHLSFFLSLPVPLFSLHSTQSTIKLKMDLHLSQ